MGTKGGAQREKGKREKRMTSVLDTTVSPFPTQRNRMAEIIIIKKKEKKKKEEEEEIKLERWVLQKDLRVKPKKPVPFRKFPPFRCLCRWT